MSSGGKRKSSFARCYCVAGEVSQDFMVSAFVNVSIQRSLPLTCQVTNSALQDPLLAEDYAMLPPLKYYFSHSDVSFH